MGAIRGGEREYVHCVQGLVKHGPLIMHLNEFFFDNACLVVMKL